MCWFCTLPITDIVQEEEHHRLGRLVGEHALSQELEAGAEVMDTLRQPFTIDPSPLPS